MHCERVTFNLALKFFSSFVHFSFVAVHKIMQEKVEKYFYLCDSGNKHHCDETLVYVPFHMVQEGQQVGIASQLLIERNWSANCHMNIYGLQYKLVFPFLLQTPWSLWQLYFWVCGLKNEIFAKYILWSTEKRKLSRFGKTWLSKWWQNVFGVTIPLTVNYKMLKFFY